MNDADLLATSALFSPLSDEERWQVEKRFARHSYDRDSYLFFEGDPAEWLVFVVEGRVKMIKHSESGRETILATFGPGQIVGEVGVLVGDTYPATAQALEPTVTLSLRRAEYVDLMRNHPDLAWALIAELGRRLQARPRDDPQPGRGKGGAAGSPRTAAHGLRLRRAPGRRRRADHRPLSRQDIADMAGTVLETAIRTLSKFQKQGLIETTQGRIILLKPHQLVAIAEEL